MQKNSSKCIIINSNFSYLPICAFYRACMILHTATFKADFFHLCIAEQLVSGTVMWALGNFPTFCCCVTPHSELAKKFLTYSSTVTS